MTSPPRPPTLSQRHTDLRRTSYIISNFHINPFRDFGASGCRNVDISMAFVIGFHNSWYTGRDNAAISLFPIKVKQGKGRILIKRYLHSKSP